MSNKPQVHLEKSAAAVLNSGGDPVGTAFAISSRLLVTCAHVATQAVAQPGGVISIRFLTNVESGPLETQVIEGRGSPVEQDDIAFLSIDSAPDWIEPVPLASASGSAGHAYRSFGFPRSAIAGARWVEEKISGLVPAKDPGKHDLLQMKGEESFHGMSGAPVIDLNLGCAVGMITFGMDERYTRFVYATTTDTIWLSMPDLAGEQSINSPVITGKTMPVDAVRLRRALTSRCDLETLQSICFELGIDYENIPGETKAGQILGLIQYCQRRDLYDRLVALIRSEEYAYLLRDE